MTIIIKQTSIHIEEIYFPSSAKKVHQLIKLFTNENEIPLAITTKKDYFDLRVFIKNFNKEAPFYEKGDTIIVNLGPIEALPNAPSSLSQEGISESKSLKQVEIEIEYIYTKPYIKNFLNLKMLSSVNFIDTVPIELRITMPLGWRIGGSSLNPFRKINEGYKIGYRCKREKKSYIFSWDDDKKNLLEFLKTRSIEWAEKAIIEKIDGDKTIRLSYEKNCIYLKLSDDKTKVNLKIDDGRTAEFIAKIENGKLNIYEKSTDFINLLFNRPFVWEYQGKKSYIYTLKHDSYEILNLKKNSLLNSELSYFLEIEFKTLIFFLIPSVFLIISILIIMAKLHIIQNIGIAGSSNNSLSFLGALLGYFYFYYKEIKEGYYVPYRFYIIGVFLISLLVVIIWAIFPNSIDEAQIKTFLNIILNIY